MNRPFGEFGDTWALRTFCLQMGEVHKINVMEPFGAGITFLILAHPVYKM